MSIPHAKSFPVKQPDRRRHIRYYIDGTLQVEIGEKVYWGSPINLGLGGILLKADGMPPHGATGIIRLDIRDFDERITVKARIIRTHETAAAAVFLTSPAALVRCVAWLDQKAQEKQAIVGT